MHYMWDPELFDKFQKFAYDVIKFCTNPDLKGQIRIRKCILSTYCLLNLDFYTRPVNIAANSFKHGKTTTGKLQTYP